MINNYSKLNSSTSTWFKKAGQKNLFFMLFFMLFSFISVNAQVDVTSSGGTPAAGYTTLKGAFDAINTGVHTGTITIGISGNTTETATAVLNASGAGSASYTSIGISPTGGAARTISGAIAAGSPLIDLNGADNVTFDGLNSGGNTLTLSNTTASGTSGTSTIRFIGGATSNTITGCSVLGSFSAAVTTNGGNIFFSTDALTPNGNDNNTVSFCNIGPAGTLSTKGIYMNGSTTNATINNSGNTFNSNNIFDYFGAAVSSAGIYIGGGNTENNVTNNKFYQTATRTQTSGAQHSAIWITNSSGNNFQVTGNTIGYSSSSATGTYTFVGFSSSSVLVPIFLAPGTTTASLVSGNTITNIAMTAISGTTSSGPFRAIYVTGLTNVTSNIIGSQSTTGSISITSSSTSSGNYYGIYNNSSSATTISSNQIGGISVTNSSTGTATFTGIYINTSSSVTATCSSNFIGGTVASSLSVSGTSASCQIVGINIGLPSTTLTSNTVRNMTNNAGTGTTTSSSVIGLLVNATSANHTVGSNTIYNLSSTVNGAATVNGIYFASSSGTNVVEKNFIYDLNGASTSAILNGIFANSGTATYKNNMVRLGTFGTSALVGLTISGINENGGTNNMYHNSVYVGGAPATAAANSFAFQSGVTTNVRNFQNNIFVNARSNNGSTGKHYAIRVGGTAANPAGLTSNFNIFYAGGTGSFTGLFNAIDQLTIADWRTATGQDAGSYTDNVPYLGATASTPDLHLSSVLSTFAEGLGTPIASVTDDFDGQTRLGLTPVDIGADALAGTGPSVVVINSVAASPSTTGLCTAVSRTITANTTAGANPITSVTLNYAFNGVAQTPILMAGGSTTGTSDWTAVIPVASPVNAAVTWSVTAVDPILTKNTVGTGYQDEPLFGLTASASATPALVCNGSTTVLSSAVSAPLTATLGAGGTTSTTTAATFLPGGWGGAKTQYIIRASELTAIGLGAGPISSLAYEVVVVGQTYQGFNVQLGHTTASVMTTTFLNTSMTQVYRGTLADDGYLPTVGVNTLAFGTGAGSSSSFVWNGTDNIVVNICWSRVPAATTSTATSMKVDNVGFVSSAYEQSDSLTPAAQCAITTGDGTGSNRPKFTIAGTTTAAISSYSWVDNTTSNVVGTTNNLTITPAGTTTYTVTMSTPGGCSATATTNTVTVQALPSAPLATNAFRCGSGLVANATVASTTGAPTPTFKWYADLTGGTALQTSTSTSYTTSIATTTTLYVTEFDGSCESSPRTPITLTVNPPPTITVTTTTGNQVNCGTGSFNVVLNATSGDSGMTYSWTTSSGTAVINSGAATATLDVTVTESSDFTVTGTPSDPTCNPVVILYPVSVYPLPVANVTTSASGVCPGTSATINSGLSSDAFSATCITPSPTLSTPPVSAVTLIDGSGVQVTTGANSTTNIDDNYWSVPIGFSFNYLGASYSSVFVSTNGILSFTAGTTSFSFPSGFPSTSSPAGAIAVCGRDLHFTAASTGVLRYWVEGNSPNRKFVVQYSDVNTYATRLETDPANIGKNSAEAVFYETLGDVDIRVINANNGIETIAGNSTNKLIGLQNVAQTIGAVAPRCSPSTPSYWNAVTTEIISPQAWRFSPPANFLVTWSSVGPGNVLTTIGTANTLNNFSLIVSPTVTTTYDLRYKNQNTGCTNVADSNRVTMTIIDNISPATVAAASATTICLGNSSNLSLTGNINSIGNTDGLTYQWQVSTDGGLNYTNIDGATNATATVTPTVASTYKCLVSACNGTAVPSTEVAIGFANSVTVTPSLGRCGNGPVDLYATASAGDVKWYANPSGGTALYTGSPYTPTINTTTTYYAAAETTGPACSSPRVPLVVTVTTPPSLTISQTTPSTICSGDSQAITLVGGGAYNSFSWSSPLTVTEVTPGVSYTLAPTTNSNYVLTATQTSGQLCVTTVPFSVNVNSVVITANVSESPICIGTSTILTADPIVVGPYAASTATNPADTEIFNVTFGSINNTSDCATTGGGDSVVNLYSDYTALAPAVVAKGATIPLSVSIGTCGITDFSKFLNVFIDYNKDGDFTDAGERVYSSAAASTLPQDEIGSILIPNTASIGTTRMRVMLQEGATSSSSPTGTYTYGETEDYSITITGTPNKSYSWTVVGNPAVISTAQTFSVTPTETTVYRVTVTDNLINCSNYTDVTVVVNSNPINTLSGGATSICLGTPTIPATIDFNSVDGLGTPTAGLIWTSSNEAVATIDNDGVLTPLTAGTTTIGAYIFNSSTGCTTYSPNTIVVNVYDPIVKTSEPTNQTILPGTNTSFTVTATGSNVQYQWYSSNNNTIFTTPVVNSAIISGAGTNVLTITGATLAMNGTYYRCAITGSSPCTSPIYSEPVLLSVQNLSITNPVSQTICNTSTTASFSVTTAGPTPDYFIWEYNDGTGWVTIEDQLQLAGNISFGGDVFTDTLVLNDILLANTTWQFRANAVIESTGDIATSNPATLTVNQSATIPSTPTDQTVCYSGGSVTFSVSASNAVSYQWQFSSVGGSNPSDWTTITSPTGPTGITYSGFTSNQLGLAVTNAISPVANYYYRAIAVSASPCNASQPSAQGQLIINNPNVAIATPDGTVSCGGALVALNASGATTYTWSSVPASVPALASVASISVAPTVNTVYTVTGTTAGCSKSASVTVTVSAATVSTATPSASTVCPGGAVQLTAAGVQPAPTAANLYTFTNNPSPLPSLDPMTGSTELVGPNSDDGVSAVNNIGFTFNFAGTNYTQFSANVNGKIRLGSTVVSSQWTNSTGNIGATAPVLMAYWDDIATGTNGKVHYVLTGSAPNRVLVVEWFVTVPIATGGTAAAKFQAKLYEGTNIIDYVYGNGMVDNTTNSGASIGIATSSTIYNNVVVTSNTNSTSTFTTTNTAAIPAGTVYRFASPNIPTYSYAWTASPADPSLTNATSATATANPTAASTTYQVVVTSNTGCKDTKTVTVVTESGVNNFVQPVAQTFCAGQTATLSASATGAGLVYTWYKVGTVASVGTGATLSIPSVTTASTGDYYVVVTATCGDPVTSNTVTLTINPLPIATISGTTSVCQIDSPQPTVTFTGTGGTAPYTFTYKINAGIDLTVVSDNSGVATVLAPVNVAGNFTYSLVSVKDATTTLCSQNQTGSVVITVKQKPTTVTLTPPAITTICQGASVNLVASGGSVGGAGNATIGTGTSLTSATSQPTAFCNRWPSYRMQTVYTAAELTAAGLTAGNINSMAFDITTLGDGATNSGFTVKISTTASSTLSGSFVSTASGFTTVYGPLTYTHTASGLQVIPFSTPYVWNGTSNIIVDVVMNGADSINNSVTRFTATAGNTVAYTTTSATNSASFSSNRLNVVFGYSSVINPTYSWSSVIGLSPTTGANVTATPEVGVTNYTATATINGCSTNSNSVAITVNPLPLASISGSTEVCHNSASPTITFTGSNGTAPYTFTYNAPGAPNQTIVSTGDTATITAPTGTVGTLTYTLLSVQDSSSTTCSNAQGGSVNITVNPLPTATIAGSTAVCQNDVAPFITFTGANATSPYTFTYNISGVPGNLTVTTALGEDSVTVAAPTGTAGTFVYTLVSVQDSSLSTCSNAQGGTATVIVHPTPTVTTVLPNQNYYAGFATAAIPLTGTPSGVTFNITGGAAAGLADVYGVSAIPSFIPTPITTPTTVTVTPVANGCIGVVKTYQIIMIPVVANITSSQCGTINNGLNNQIQAGNVSVPGYVTTGYRFEVTNTATGEVAYVDSVQSMFKLTDTSIYSYGTTFAIRVAVILNGNVQGFFGNTCTLTTASVQTTKVVTAQCGATLAALNSTINANSVGSTNLYRFRVALASAPTTYYLLERSVPNFNLSMVPGLPLTYETEYRVDVQIRVKLAGFEAWSQFGAVCSIFTPVAPTTSVTLADCELVAPSLTQTIHVVSYPGATMYRVRLTGYDEFGDVNYTQTVDNVNPSFTLSQFTGLTPDTNYTVDVSMELFGSFTPYGKQCSVVTPPVLKAALATTFKAVAYPNPFANNFMIDVKSSSQSSVNLKVYDMIGRLVEQRDVRVSDLETSTIGERYPSGVYNVVVSQDDSVQTVRVVKR